MTVELFKAHVEREKRNPSICVNNSEGNTFRFVVKWHDVTGVLCLLFTVTLWKLLVSMASQKQVPDRNWLQALIFSKWGDQLQHLRVWRDIFFSDLSHQVRHTAKKKIYMYIVYRYSLVRVDNVNDKLKNVCPHFTVHYNLILNCAPMSHHQAT